MKSFTIQARRFSREENGVTAIEYALIASLIAVVIVGAVTAIGTTLNSTFVTVVGLFG